MTRVKEKTLSWDGGLLSFCFFTLGLAGGESIHEFIYRCPSSFLPRAEFGKVLSPMHLQPLRFSTPPPPAWCSRAGRKGGGGECHWQLPPRGSWLWFICKAPEEAGEFPEAPSSCLLRYQHPAKASLTDFFSFQILAVPLCFLTVPSRFLACIRLGRRRRERQGLMSEGLLDESRWGRVSPRRWKALHSMEVCKRARQCQVVFTQVASSCRCLWSSPPASSETESWIRPLKLG